MAIVSHDGVYTNEPIDIRTDHKGNIIGSYRVGSTHETLLTVVCDKCQSSQVNVLDNERRRAIQRKFNQYMKEFPKEPQNPESTDDSIWLLIGLGFLTFGLTWILAFLLSVTKGNNIEMKKERYKTEKAEYDEEMMRIMRSIQGNPNYRDLVTTAEELNSNYQFECKSCGHRFVHKEYEFREHDSISWPSGDRYITKYDGRPPVIHIPIRIVSPSVKANADLHGIDLSGADLTGTDLHGAILSHASLRSTNLTNTNLHGANLSNASLRNADLTEANLTRASLRDADLTGADLRSADLSSAFFKNANLTSAKYNSLTKWPRNFDPITKGAIICTGYGSAIIVLQ